MSQTSSTFVIVNDWIKLDCKNDAFVSRKPIPKGTRILIERPLFQIGEPPEYQPLANALFLFSKFKLLPQDCQNEILIQTLETLEAMYGNESKNDGGSKSTGDRKCKDKYQVGGNSGALRVLFPLRRMNNNIGKLMSAIRKSIKNDHLSKYIANEYEWKKLETLLNIFEQYSIDLKFDTPNVKNMKSIAYYNDSLKFQERINFNTRNENDNDNESDVVNLGKGLFRFSSQFGHSCSPTCNINVIDEIGTIEIRTTMDISQSNVILTRNYLFNQSMNMNMNGAPNPNTDKNLISYFGRLNSFDSNMVIPTFIRKEQLSKCYNFDCQCDTCSDFDKTRGFLHKHLPPVKEQFKNKRYKQKQKQNKSRKDSSVSGPHCNGIVLCKPYVVNGKEKEKDKKTNNQHNSRNKNKNTVSCGDKVLWQCNECNEIISQERMNKMLSNEKKLESRLIGLESLINYGFREIDKSKILYKLLQDACLHLSHNHWIVIRLLWICFEESISKHELNLSLIYLKRHIELAKSISNQFATLTIANKCELLADLLPINENYKIKAMQMAIESQTVLRGQVMFPSL